MVGKNRLPVSTFSGYHGRYLRVDLSCGSGESIAIRGDVLRRFLGGSGLGAWLLLAENAAEHDPLAPDSLLAFVFSPLVGSPLTTSAKFAVVSKSPLTGRINDALASSGFALAGKRSGFDAIAITGCAAELSILVIDDGAVRIDSAVDLAGLSTSLTESMLRERYGPDYSFAVIGPAGERLVRYATISHAGRHAGRGGSGAVLGAKNLKAVAVRGTQRTAWAHPRELARLAKDLSARSFGPATAKYRELGTASNLLTFNRLRALPTRNFQAGSFDEAANLAPETLSLARERTRASCVACTIGCEHIYALSSPHAPREEPTLGTTATSPGLVSRSETPTVGVRLEYENLFALGPLCGIGDAEAVLRASKLCDELGLDTISTGGTIAFAMEAVDRGVLDAPWLRFGDGKALLRAIDLIGRRDGIGDLLAEGSRRAAEHIGQDSIAFAPQVKGLELPGYEPRALQTMALGLAVATRGADHNRSGAYEADFSERADRRRLSPEAAHLAIETEDKAALMDSLILCKFLRGVFHDFYAESAEMLRLVTGWDVASAELRVAAARIVAAKKLFNIRAGWTPAEDTLPPRFLGGALRDDPAARLAPDQLAAAIAAYNVARGWSPEGWIGNEQLAALALADLAEASIL
jgi:aldehyde:ferredoxin oxidoreductase